MPPKSRLRKRSVQRFEIEQLLASSSLPGDTPSKRNDRRQQRVENHLRSDTKFTDDEISAIISDLPSYTNWERVPGTVNPRMRQV